MLQSFTLTRRLGAAAAALAVSAAMCAPLAAAAQDVPSYAQPSYASADETIHGRIRSVEGAFTISVDDDRGFVDNVQLHQGTIINPTGLTLSPGMSVTILGANAGPAFSANEIDTPYSYAGPLPTPVYYGPGYWCPGFAYGYGPSFSLAIIFGGGARPWYYQHQPYFGRPWNGHAYFGTSIAWAPQDHARIEPGHAYTSSADRQNAGAPADRSYAGESRVGPERFDTQSTERFPTAQHSTYGHESPAYAHGSAPAGGYARGGGSVHQGAPAHSGGGGHAGGGDHGGGGHAH